MLEVIHNDSIKALRARGISERSVIWKHALKNALPPIVTVLGLQIASCFTGAILTESIFSWPGMGTMIVNAINNRDYMLIQGVVLFFALVFVVVNLLVDIAYMLINPRVSYEGKRRTQPRPLHPIFWALLPTRNCCAANAGPTAPGAN